MPTSKTGRRPKRSDTGPQNSCEIPKAKTSAVRVSWACVMLAPKPVVSAGKAGRYRSVLSGCRPISSAISSTTRPAGMAVRVDVSVVVTVAVAELSGNGWAGMV